MSWDPVHDGRAAFRACLDAVCRPGSCHPLPTPGLDPDPALDGAAAVLLALLDSELALAVAGPAGFRALADELRSRTGARAGGVAEADLVLATSGYPVASVARRGTPAAPEHGATIVYVASGGPPVEALLDGPGLPAPTRVWLPLDGVELRALVAANANTPVGVDAFLVAADGLRALPRSTRVTEAAA